MEGGCSCGAVRYRLTTEPLVVHCCHCLNCQRQTGSAFVINLLIEADRVELLAGEPRPVSAARRRERPADLPLPRVRGRRLQRVRPPGGALRTRGTLDDPSAVAPDVHIYTRSKMPWVTLPPSVPAFDVYYDSKTLWPPEKLERLRAAFRASPA